MSASTESNMKGRLLLALHEAFTGCPHEFPEIAKVLLGVFEKYACAEFGVEGYRATGWNIRTASWETIRRTIRFPEVPIPQPDGIIFSPAAQLSEALKTQTDHTLSGQSPPMSHVAIPQLARFALRIEVWPESPDRIPPILTELEGLRSYLQLLLYTAYRQSEERAQRHIVSESVLSPLTADANVAFEIIDTLKAMDRSWHTISLWRTSRTNGNLDKLAEMFSPRRNKFRRETISSWPPSPILSYANEGRARIYFPPAILVVSTEQESSLIEQSFTRAVEVQSRLLTFELESSGGIGPARRLRAIVPLPHNQRFDAGPSCGDPDPRSTMIRHLRDRLVLLLEHSIEDDAPPLNAFLIVTAQRGRRQATGMGRALRWSPISKIDQDQKDTPFEVAAFISFTTTNTVLFSFNILRAIDRVQQHLPFFDLLSAGRSITKRTLEAFAESAHFATDPSRGLQGIAEFVKAQFSTNSWALIDLAQRKVSQASGLFSEFQPSADFFLSTFDKPIAHTDAGNSPIQALVEIAAHIDAREKGQAGRLISSAGSKSKDPPAPLGVAIWPIGSSHLLAIVEKGHWKLRPVEKTALDVLAQIVALSIPIPLGQPSSGGVKVSAIKFDAREYRFHIDPQPISARDVVVLGLEIASKKSRFIRPVFCASAMASVKSAERVSLESRSLARHAIDSGRFQVGHLKGGNIILDSDPSQQIVYHGLIHAEEGDVVTAAPLLEIGNRSILGIVVASFSRQSYDSTDHSAQLKSQIEDLSRDLSIAQAKQRSLFEAQCTHSLKELALLSQSEALTTRTQLILDTDAKPRTNMPPEIHTIFSAPCRANLVALFEAASGPLRFTAAELSQLPLPYWQSEPAAICSYDDSSNTLRLGRARGMCLRDIKTIHGEAGFSHRGDDISGTVQCDGDIVASYYAFSEGNPIRRRFLLFFTADSKPAIWLAERSTQVLVEHFRTFIRMRLNAIAALDGSAAFLRRRVIDFWIHEIKKLTGSAVKRHLQVLRTSSKARKVKGGIEWAVKNAQKYIELSAKRSGTGATVTLLAPDIKSTAASFLAPPQTPLYLYELLVEQIMTMRQCGDKTVHITLGLVAEQFDEHYLRIVINNSYTPSAQTRLLSPYLFNVQIPSDYKRDGKCQSGTGLFYCGRMLRSVGIIPRFRETTIGQGPLAIDLLVPLNPLPQ